MRLAISKTTLWLAGNNNCPRKLGCNNNCHPALSAIDCDRSGRSRNTSSHGPIATGNPQGSKAWASGINSSVAALAGQGSQWLAGLLVAQPSVSAKGPSPELWPGFGNPVLKLMLSVPQAAGKRCNQARGRVPFCTPIRRLGPLQAASNPAPDNSANNERRVSGVVMGRPYRYRSSAQA